MTSVQLQTDLPVVNRWRLQDLGTMACNLTWTSLPPQRYPLPVTARTSFAHVVRELAWAGWCCCCSGLLADNRSVETSVETERRAHCDSCKVNVIMPRNVICDYFTKSETDANKAKCMECLKLLSLGSDKPGKQTVHGLKCHLDKTHKELFAKYTTKRAKNHRRRNLSWTNTQLRSRNSFSSHCQSWANDPLNGQTTTRLYSALTKPSWT